MLHQPPSGHEPLPTRWTLAGLLAATSDWLKLGSLPGISQLLHRLRIGWKRGRYHVHSPDPDYVAKLRAIKRQVLQTGQDPPLVLFTDEFTLSRHPSLSWAYEQQGGHQPLAELGYQGNYTWRIAAALNPYTGQVSYFQAWVIDVPRMIRFYHRLHQTYPDRHLLLVQDNWPLHAHPDVRAALQPQTFPFPLHLPPSWPTEPTRPIPATPLPIQLLFLPTYASWTNPIEKLWRLLRQEVLHLHRYADAWPALKLRVWDFLDQFQSGSTDLLRYVGLSDLHKLYQSLFPPGSLLDAVP